MFYSLSFIAYFPGLPPLKRKNKVKIIFESLVLEKIFWNILSFNIADNSIFNPKLSPHLMNVYTFVEGVP